MYTNSNLLGDFNDPINKSIFLNHFFLSVYLKIMKKKTSTLINIYRSTTKKKKKKILFVDC